MPEEIPVKVFCCNSIKCCHEPFRAAIVLIDALDIIDAAFCPPAPDSFKFEFVILGKLPVGREAIRAQV